MEQLHPTAGPGIKIAFVIDTSASMNQRASNGMRLVDIAKAAVETFLARLRSRTSSAPPPTTVPDQPIQQPSISPPLTLQQQQIPRIERFFLVTCEGTENEDTGNSNLSPKVGWLDNFPTFVKELKTLKAVDMTGLGSAVKKTFDLINAFRIQSGVDSYSQGRCPWLAEYSAIILITDGSSLISFPDSQSNTPFVSEQFSIPRSTMCGNELTFEPFRWDQRFHSLILRFPGVAAVNSNANSSSQQTLQPEPLIAPMCEVTGGKCAIVTSMKSLSTAVDFLLSKLQSGVIINIEPFSPPSQQSSSSPSSSSSSSQPNTPLFQPCLHKLLFFNLPISTSPQNQQNFNQQQQQQMIWPIPESYYPDVTMNAPPPRTAQPTIKVLTIESDSRIPQGFPFDKYELELPCGSMLQAMQTSCKNGCWNTFIAGSGQAKDYPFGFFKLGQNNNAINFFVLPYNFPKLWTILDELPVQSRNSPSPQWKSKLEAYLQSIPPYYIQPMRIALKRFGILQTVIPDYIDGSLPHSMISFFKGLKLKSKSETDKLQFPYLRTQQQTNQQQSLQLVLSRHQFNEDQYTNTNNFHAILDKQSTSVYAQQKEQNEERSSTPDDLPPPDLVVARNAFDIPRSQLLRTVSLLRGKLFFSPTMASDEAKHKVPIDQMGDYIEVLSKKSVLRPIDEEKEKRNRTPLFGNPFKRISQQQQQQQFVDEADAIDGQNQQQNNPNLRRQQPQKRKRFPQTSPSSYSSANGSVSQPMTKASKSNNANEATTTTRMSSFIWNSNLRLAVYREIRKPSNSYDSEALKSLLQQIRGDSIMKKEFFKELNEQARLFGSKKALQLIETFQEKDNI